MALGIGESVAELSDELDFFVRRSRMEPMEKLEATEAFVREVGYYDFDNGEVRSEKQGLSLSENLSTCRRGCRS